MPVFFQAVLGAGPTVRFLSTSCRLPPCHCRLPNFRCLPEIGRGPLPIRVHHGVRGDRSRSDHHYLPALPVAELSVSHHLCARSPRQKLTLLLCHIWLASFRHGLGPAHHRNGDHEHHARECTRKAEVLGRTSDQLNLSPSCSLIQVNSPAAQWAGLQILAAFGREYLSLSLPAEAWVCD